MTVSETGISEEYASLVVGSGTAILSLKTANGDIRIERVKDGECSQHPSQSSLSIRIRHLLNRFCGYTGSYIRRDFATQQDLHQKQYAWVFCRIAFLNKPPYLTLYTK